MKVTTKFASLALAAALVGSVAIGGATAADAAAKPKVTGKAIITFDPGFGALVKATTPILPARFYAAKLGFPVKSADSHGISLAGGMSFPSAGAELKSPVVSVTSSQLKTGSFVVTVPTTPGVTVTLEVFALTHFTSKVTGKTTVWTGDVELTRNPGGGVDAQKVADMFSYLSGKTLAPGDKLGRIEITVNTK